MFVLAWISPISYSYNFYCTVAYAAGHVITFRCSCFQNIFVQNMDMWNNNFDSLNKTLHHSHIPQKGRAFWFKGQVVLY